MTSRFKAVLIAVTVIGLAGCSQVISGAIDTAARRTGEGIGNAVGQRTGQMAGAAVSSRFPNTWTPDMSAIYVNYMFTLAFHSGSYTFANAEYEPGEWTRWRMTSDDEGPPPEMERAFLARNDDGSEWWRVKYVADNGEGVDSMVVEMLFDRETGEVRRMRGKMPGETEAKEMPVESGTYTYIEPTELTEESVEGATVGMEQIRVPAGSFEARHVRYGGMGGNTLDWWLNDQVPGDMVKYSNTVSGEEAEGSDMSHYVMELLRYGTGARSELGVM